MPLFNIFCFNYRTAEFRVQSAVSALWTEKESNRFYFKKKKDIKKNATLKFKFMLKLNLFIRNKTTLSAERPYIRIMHTYSLQAKLAMPV